MVEPEEGHGAILTFTQEAKVEARSGESKRVVERGRALFEAVT